MTKGITRRCVERLYYIVQDQPDGSLMFYRGDLFLGEGLITADQRVSPTWKSRDEAVGVLHGHGFHRQGFRILKLAVEP